jgi:hypothetical protein
MDEDEFGATEDEPIYENIPDEEAHEHNQWLRVLLGVIALLIVSALVVLPVLRVLAANDDLDPEQGARDARQYVAERFSEAVLEQRSTWRSTHWAVPDLHADVDRVVAYLQTRDETLLAGAERSLAPVTCIPEQVSHFERPECFQAWLRKPGDGEIVRIAFVVAIADNAARVVDVTRLANA